MLESSYSIGSAGMGLFLAARLGWNEKADITTEMRIFFSQMFGSSAQVVKEYFQETTHGFGGLSDVIYLQNKLNKEREMQKDAKVASRILQLQAYLHYLLLYYQWNTASEDTRESKWEKAMLYTWQIYHTGLIHSTRIAEMLNWHANLPEAKVKPWNPYLPDAPNLQHVKNLNENDLNAIVGQDVRANPLLEDFAYLPKIKKNNYSLKAGAQEEKQPDEGLLIRIFPETFVRPSHQLKVEFFIKVNIGSTNNSHQNITAEVVDTSSGKTVLTTRFSIDSAWKRVQLKLPADKIYRLIVKNEDWIRLYVPKHQWYGVTTIPTHTVMGKLWFWMPSGTRYLYYSNNSKEQPIFSSPSGQVLKAEKINQDQQMYRLNVPAEYRAKWWAIDETQYQFIQFYRKPDIFFFHPNYEVQ